MPQSVVEVRNIAFSIEKRLEQWSSAMLDEAKHTTSGG